MSDLRWVDDKVGSARAAEGMVQPLRSVPQSRGKRATSLKTSVAEENSSANRYSLVSVTVALEDASMEEQDRRCEG